MPHLFRPFNHPGKVADPPTPLSQWPSFFSPALEQQAGTENKILKHNNTAKKGRAKKDFGISSQVTFQLLF
jgi:hypothetical protein